MRYLRLYIPFLLALAILYAPAPLSISSLSYLVAWLGSFYIFWVTFTGKIKTLPGEGSLSSLMFRPLGFPHLIFIGYNAITSIFYFLSINGYVFFEYQGVIPFATHSFATVAWAQTYYVLAHAALVHGIFLGMDYSESGKWQFNVKASLPTLALYLAVCVFVVSSLLKLVPGLGQVALIFKDISLVASVISLALSIVHKKWLLILLNIGLYGINFYLALLSGMKEEVLILILLLFVFLYPHYKKSVALVTPVILSILLFVLPFYVNTFRKLSWQGNVNSEKAVNIAIDRFEKTNINKIKKINWSFWTNRATLIEMFCQYIEQVPSKRSYYGLQLIKQSAMNLIPRIIWPEKPITEDLVMQRVYENGVANPKSSISAKPPYIMDSYLFGGTIGVFSYMIFFGLISALASVLAEKWFGGYFIGGGIFYLSIFETLWKGATFEFFFSTIFWSFIIMFAIFIGLRWLNIIIPKKSCIQY